MEALERLSNKQSEMSATLGRIEKNSAVFRNSFVPFVSDSYAEEDPSRMGIVDYIWSSDAMLFESNGTRKVHSFPGSIGQLTAPDLQHMSHLNSQTPGYEERAHEAAITSSLHFSGRNHREVSIPDAHTETFQWIYDGSRQAEPGSGPRVGFVPWLEGDAKEPYWITGKPGAGKSTLMKFVTKDARTRQHLLKWSSQRPLILASFYFWNAAASQLQKSQTGLLRSLLVQCIEQMPSICRKVCPRRWAFLRLFGVGFLQDAPEWTWEELKECFQAMTALIGDRFNLSLFIDGLDEFDGQYQELIKFVELFQSRGGVKILVSSRPENEFVDAFQVNPSLKMEHFTATDVRTFAQGELNRTRGFLELLQANPLDAEGLVGGVVEKAKGVFLWVSVVVRALCEGLTEGDSLTDLRRLLDTLPTDLSDLYSSIWVRIRSDYRAHSSRLFQIHRCSTTLLDVATLHLADMETNVALAQVGLIITDASRIHITQTLTRRLNSRTRGLLEISNDGKVDFLHRSVRDWTVSKWDEICSMTGPEFDPHLALLTAMTVEISSITMEHVGMSFVTRFWTEACVCLHHAGKVQDAPSTFPSLMKVLDIFDVEMSKFSTFDASLSLYRNTDYASLRVRNAKNLPHWATTQYTVTPDQLNNNFLGLAAQFAILPYVREKISRDSKLLLKPDPSTLPVLECAVLGFRSICRPDIADLASSYVGQISWDTRLQLVCYLLEQGTCKYEHDSRQKGKDLYRQEQLASQILQNKLLLESISDVDQAEQQYWNNVSVLCERRVVIFGAQSAKAPRGFLSRFRGVKERLKQCS